MSEVLNRVFTAGVGERNDAWAKRAAPCTEIPSVGSMFAMVKKVRPLLCAGCHAITLSHYEEISIGLRRRRKDIDEL